jgi:type IV secretory pathway TrbD component
MSQSQPREVLFHQSANRPTQLMGCDRELLLIAMLAAVLLAFSLATWWGVMVALVFWFAAVAVLSRLGKADPMLRQVYVAHMRYQAFYPAKSGLYSQTLQRPKRWR